MEQGKRTEPREQDAARRTVWQSASGNASATSPPMRIALVWRIMCVRSHETTSSLLTQRWWMSSKPLRSRSSSACFFSWSRLVEMGVPLTSHMFLAVPTWGADA